MTKRTSGILLFWARLLVSAAILVLLLRGLDAKRVGTSLLASNPLNLVVAVALLGLQVPVMNLRWVLIMKAAGAALAKGPAMRILLISFWFNQALPSSLGGDAVRVWLLRERGIEWGPAVRGVLADRLTALFGLIVIICAGFPFLIARIHNPAAIITVGTLALMGITGMASLATLDYWPAAILAIKPISSFVRLGALTRFLLFRYRHRATVLTFALLIHVLTIVACLMLAWGIDAPLSTLDAFILVPPVILLSALPISISGWGVREGAMVAMLTLAGITPEAALSVSVLLGLAAAAIGVVGGIVWVTGRDREKFTEEQVEDVARHTIAAD